MTRLGLPGWRLVVGDGERRDGQGMPFRLQRRVWWGWWTVRGAGRHFTIQSWMDADLVLKRVEYDQTKPKGERTFG